MDRLERFYKIQRLLERKRVVPVGEFLESLGVSLATFKRDLEYMRDRFHAPIEWDRDAGGYRFTAPGGGAPAGPKFELPGLWFNASEVRALLTMQHLLANLQPGLLGPHVQPLVARLRSLLDAGDHPVEEVERRIRILHHATRGTELPFFDVAASAVLRRQRLAITYRGRGRNDRTEREISPQRLVHYRENWYLDAWCHLRDDLRSFAVDAIEAAALADKKAKNVPERELDEVLAAGYGIFSGRDTRWAKLRFSPERARWVGAESWHPRQKGSTAPDGSYLLELPFSDPRELVMDILRHGPHVEVLEPASLRKAVATPGVVFIATSQQPDALDPRLRAPDLCDRELGLSLPDAATRKALLEVLLRDVPAQDLELSEIADRTPGFVRADLAALVREAALRAAARASEDGKPPSLTQADFKGALTVIRPLSRSATEEVSVGSVTLEDVGDMADTKAALTEAVLWPLQHPDTFARLGVDPPKGVLLYGPPGCGKTFVVRALASSGRLSVHSVKGAELMDKWVGSSEKAVRELFRRARDSAPSLVFLDEIDAMAPRRGQSFDSGVTDRVVASLLTELDGIEPLRDVVVLGATNRPDLIDPALLRPGRLEKLVFVEPPDADARREILRTAGKSVPLSADVDLDKLATELDGYSAADCVALLREAALTAMRRSIDAADVTAADVTKARETVRPSLDPVQVESLRAFAEGR